jgi:hypothetical protein
MYRRLVVPVLVLATVLTGCASGVGAASGRPPVAPTIPPPTIAPAPPPSVLDDVMAAYRRSWAVYSEAVARVEPAGLPEAFAGSALVLRRQEVERLRRAGAAIRVRVTHRPEVVLVDADTAVVTDVLDNHMIRVDHRTGRPREPDPDDVLTRAYTLRREGGLWKVTEAVALG